MKCQVNVHSCQVNVISCQVDVTSPREQNLLDNFSLKEGFLTIPGRRQTGAPAAGARHQRSAGL